MVVFDKSYGSTLTIVGTPMMKKPNPVFMLRVNDDFEIITEEGRLSAKKGDWIAHDPLSGHVWPVAAAYAAMHYEAI